MSIKVYNGFFDDYENNLTIPSVSGYMGFMTNAKDGIISKYGKHLLMSLTVFR